MNYPIELIEAIKTDYYVNKMKIRKLEEKYNMLPREVYRILGKRYGRPPATPDNMIKQDFSNGIAIADLQLKYKMSRGAICMIIGVRLGRPKGPAKKPVFPPTYKRGAWYHPAGVTGSQVSAIRRMHKNGYTLARIASVYTITEDEVKDICSAKLKGTFWEQLRQT